MDKLPSEKLKIKAPAEKIYNFITDFNNFEKLMPEQVADWQSTTESCSFRIEGLATIGMRMKTKTPHSYVLIEKEGDAPFDFQLECNFEKIDSTSCESQIIFYAKLNPMYSMLVSKPLSNFVNMLNTKLKELADSGQLA